MCNGCRVVKLVRALRKGWIKRESEDPKEPEIYLMWADDGNVAGWTASGMSCKICMLLSDFADHTDAIIHSYWSS